MSRASRPIVFVASLLFGCAQGGLPTSLEQAASGEAATVEADKPDYSPGETALLSGSGWAPNEGIAIHIECTCGCSDDLLATADDGGGFAGLSYPITDEHLGAACTVTARGSVSERVAMTSFTDGNIRIATEPTGVSATFTVREFK